MSSPQGGGQAPLWPLLGHPPTSVPPGTPWGTRGRDPGLGRTPWGQGWGRWRGGARGARCPQQQVTHHRVATSDHPWSQGWGQSSANPHPGLKPPANPLPRLVLLANGSPPCPWPRPPWVYKPPAQAVAVCSPPGAPGSFPPCDVPPWQRMEGTGSHPACPGFGGAPSTLGCTLGSPHPGGHQRWLVVGGGNVGDGDTLPALRAVGCHQPLRWPWGPACPDDGQKPGEEWGN